VCIYIYTCVGMMMLILHVCTMNIERVKKSETWPSHKLYVFVHKYQKGICEELTNVGQVGTLGIIVYVHWSKGHVQRNNCKGIFVLVHQCRF
jgi:hypothetical protein